jgi:hypothetical protein
MPCHGHSKRLRRRYGRTAMPAKLTWHQWAGGTGAHPDVKSYSATGLFGEYHIWPRGHLRHCMYSLKWANTNGMPAEHDGLWHELGVFASPSRAKKAAEEHVKALQSTARDE